MSSDTTHGRASSRAPSATLRAAATIFAVALVALFAACDSPDPLERCHESCVAAAECNNGSMECEAKCDEDIALITDSNCDGYANTLYECYEGQGACTPNLDERCATEAQALSDCESAYCLAHPGAANCPK